MGDLNGLCPRRLTTGSCSDPHCSHNHDFRMCEPCGMVVQPASAYNTHLATSGHEDRMLSNWCRCPICSICVPRKSWNSHAKGSTHLKKAAQQGLRVKCQMEIPSFVPGHRLCKTCNLQIQDIHWKQHPQRSEHLQREKMKTQIADMRKSLQHAAKDKEGVVVSQPDGVDFGVIDLSARTTKHRTHIIVVGSRPVRIVRLQVVSAATGALDQRFSAQPQNKSFYIPQGVEFHIVLSFSPKNLGVGRVESRLEILFEDTTKGKHFTIIRSVKAAVGDTSDHMTLAPSAPYEAPQQRRARVNFRLKGVVWGDRSGLTKRHPYVVKIDPYPLPKELAEALGSGPQDIKSILERLPSAFKDVSLSEKNYTKALTAQLWIEEHRARTDMDLFDMTDTRLDQRGNNYTLRVPGLAENRPSVVLGDGVFVQTQENSDSKWFEGIVQNVRSEYIDLHFHSSFKGHSTASRYSVRFGFNRYPLRRQHQALNRAFGDARIFFPRASHVKALKRPQASITLYNHRIQENPSQLMAVKAIVNLPPGSHPFVVFGPPGTGKTVTIVEAILQILRSDKNSCVLACAPSNSAADLITERLLSVLDKDHVLRYYAPSRPSALSPLAVRECAFQEDGLFAVPSKDYVDRFRVVVSTCGSASFAYNIGIEPGHFSHIFIDEAGQGSEPEVMVPIKTMCTSRTNIVLSGDPKQLGPVIRSPVARELGLGKSYLERLMDYQVYDEDEGEGRSIVKLIYNYRSHPKIIDFPNFTFYNGDLVPCGHPAIVNSFQNCSLLPKQGFPVVFHAVAGQDMREASSPSYFNIDEVTQVKAYIQAIISQGNASAEEIGVITPYHAQAMKIRSVLASTAKKVQVASVEMFQGQERKVIILSTVRSTRDLMGYDLKHTLGFVGNPRRFNVAMTRAQALLIVVGDPAVLGLDPLWRAWLNHVYLGGGWTGFDGPTWDARAEVDEAGGYDRAARESGFAQMTELAQRLEAFNLGAEVDDDDGNFEVGLRNDE